MKRQVLILTELRKKILKSLFNKLDISFNLPNENKTYTAMQIIELAKMKKVVDK
jgi:hypothetical protein